MNFSGYDYSMFGPQQSISGLRVKVSVSLNTVVICYILLDKNNTITINKIKERSDYSLQIVNKPGFDIIGDITSISMYKDDCFKTIETAVKFLNIGDNRAYKLIAAIGITDKDIMNQFLSFFQ